MTQKNVMKPRGLMALFLGGPKDTKKCHETPWLHDIFFVMFINLK